MSHLEDLIAEYYDWTGHVVKRNLKVGRLKHGGWEMEIDVVAYHPHNNTLVHLEPSLDAHSWERREERFSKKFAAGRKYIFSEVFTWLPADTPLQQIAILPSHPNGHALVGGGEILSIDEFMGKVKAAVGALPQMARGAVPEQYPLLRTIQLTVRGYHGVVTVPDD